MIRRLLCAVPIAACTTSSSATTALVEIPDAKVTIQSSNDPTDLYGSAPGVSFQVQIDHGDCPRITDDTTATLDGTPLTAASRGGLESTTADSACLGVVFSSAGPPAGASSQLVIRDATATWTIEASQLFANDFELAANAGGPGEITWDSATSIDQADARLAAANGAILWSSVNYDDQVPRAQVAIGGNTFSISAPISSSGVRTLAVTAKRVAPADSCSGPATCSVEVRAGRQFALE